MMSLSRRMRAKLFASYLPLPDLGPADAVAGSAGLVPLSWDASHDQWGRRPDPEPLRETEFAAYDCAGHAGMDRRAYGRRSHPHTNSGDPKTVFSFIKGKRLFHCRLQGSAAYFKRIGICSCVSRFCLPTAAALCRCRRRRGSCTRTPNSIRSASTGLKPNANCNDSGEVAHARYPAYPIGAMARGCQPGLRVYRLCFR